MAKEFKVYLEFTTKEDIPLSELQRYFRHWLFNNGDIESFKLKTEIKED